MDIIKVLKVVQYFHEEILSKAYYFSSWNEEHIADALLWAKRCEQVYSYFCNSPNIAKLDELIHLMNEKSEDKRIYMCFENLKRSSEILAQAFFENPNIKKELVQTIFLKERNEEIASEIIKNAIDLDLLCLELVETLKNITILDSDRSFYYEVKAEIYLDFLKNTVKQMTTEQIESHLSEVFESLCENKDKMMLLIHILMHQGQNSPNDVKEIQEFAINWILLRLLPDKKCKLAHFLWKQPASRLRGIATNSVSFYSFYFSFLIKCASSMKRDFENEFTSWKSELIGEEEVLSFEDILNHIRCLLSIDDDICESTKRDLLNTVNDQPNVLIYKEIFSRVS